MSVLRECAPEVFAFLLRNIDPLRRKTDQFNSRPAQAKKEWEELVKTNELARVATNLVAVLGLEQLRLQQFSQYEVPQGVREMEPTDYFRRILAEEVDPGNVRDQDVLSDI